MTGNDQCLSALLCPVTPALTSLPQRAASSTLMTTSVGSWQVGMGRSCSETSWAALMTMAFMLGRVGMGYLVVRW